MNEFKPRLTKIKLITDNNILFYHLFFLNGNIFYSIEYSYYLKNYYKTIIMVPSQKFLDSLYEKWIEKYNKEKLYKILKKVIFIKEDSCKIISKNLLILDYSSFQKLDKNVFAQKIIYNYGDDEKSLKHQLRSKRVITIGDYQIGCKVDHHYPLCLNFKLFKTLDEILPIKEDVFHEYKNEDIMDRKRNIKDFHSSFNKLIFEKHNFWERANRIIPECKFYNKEIELITDDPFDSANLRYISSWKDYDINYYRNLNEELSFKNFLKNAEKGILCKKVIRRK